MHNEYMTNANAVPQSPATIKDECIAAEEQAHLSIGLFSCSNQQPGQANGKETGVESAIIVMSFLGQEPCFYSLSHYHGSSLCLGTVAWHGTCT